MIDVTGVNPADYSPGASAESRMANQDFGTDLFLQLLVTQLRYQDPLSDSQDTGDMITQLTMFTLLERVINLQEAVEKQTRAQENQQALGLLNREVVVLGFDYQAVSGTVSAVEFSSTGPIITVDGHEYPASAVIKVATATGTDGAGPEIEDVEDAVTEVVDLKDLEGEQDAGAEEGGSALG